MIKHTQTIHWQFELNDEAVLRHTLTDVDLYHCHEILSSHMTNLGKPM